MKRLFAIIVMLPLLAGSCSDEEDILPEQQKKMVSFLTSTHSPRLVDKAGLDPESREPYYTTAGKTVYKYIRNIYDPNRENWAKVTPTSKVTITYRAYVFNYTAITDANFDRGATTVTAPYDSNDTYLEEMFYSGDFGLTPGGWVFEPLVVDMTKPDNIIKGLHLALIGQGDGDECRAGDQVEAYMTYNMAYGDKEYIYFIPKQTPLAFFFSVDNVE